MAINEGDNQSQEEANNYHTLMNTIDDPSPTHAAFTLLVEREPMVYGSRRVMGPTGRTVNFGQETLTRLGILPDPPQPPRTPFKVGDRVKPVPSLTAGTHSTASLWTVVTNEFEGKDQNLVVAKLGNHIETFGVDRLELADVNDYY